MTVQSAKRIVIAWTILAVANGALGIYSTSRLIASRWTPPATSQPPATFTQEVVGDLAYTSVYEEQWDIVATLVTQFSQGGWDLTTVDRRYPYGFDHAALVTLYFHRHQAAPAVVTVTVPAAGTATPCATPDPFKSLGGGVCANGGWRPR